MVEEVKKRLDEKMRNKRFDGGGDEKVEKKIEIMKNRLKEIMDVMYESMRKIDEIYNNEKEIKLMVYKMENRKMRKLRNELNIFE